MGKQRTLQERLDKASSMIVSHASTAHKWGEKARRYTEADKHAQAMVCFTHVLRAERLLARWEAEALRLTRLRKIQEQGQRTAQILTMRAPVRPNGHHYTPRQMKEREKRDRLARIEKETKRKKCKASFVEFDPRTAQALRPYRFVNLGSSLRASVNHFEAVIRRKDEQTSSRLLAWAEFDEHCHRVHKGELPSAKFEPGVDSSGRAGMSPVLLEALQADAVLRDYLGRDMHGMLVQIIYFQRNLRDLVGQGYGDERIMAGMFRRALDLAASYFKCGEDQSFGRKISVWRASAAIA
jgi:hypothetical protein